MATATLSALWLNNCTAVSAEERGAVLTPPSPEDACEALLHDWPFWARPEQLPPEDDDWDVFLLLGGRGSGKTRPAAELIHQWAHDIPGGYFALVGETAAEVRDVMLEGESGLLATQKPWNPCIYEPSKRRVVWQNGSGRRALAEILPINSRTKLSWGWWMN